MAKPRRYGSSGSVHMGVSASPHPRSVTPATPSKVAAEPKVQLVAICHNGGHDEINVDNITSWSAASTFESPISLTLRPDLLGRDNTELAAVVDGLFAATGDDARLRSEMRDAINAAAKSIFPSVSDNVAHRRQIQRLCILSAMYATTDDDSAADHTIDVLRDLGIDGLRKNSIVAEVRKIRKQLQQVVDSDPANTMTVKDKWPDSPVSVELILPIGWRIVDGRIVAGRGDGETLSPVLIGAVSRNAQTNELRVELVWSQGASWARRWVSRRTIADAREIVALSSIGFPVTSVNARDMVRWLAAFEIANDKIFQRMTVVSTLGWNESRTSFALGNAIIGNDEAQPLEFQAAAEGEARLAGTLGKAGTMNGWESAIAPALQSPVCRFAMAAALAAPLLAIVGTPSFSVCLIGPSSRGKTLALRVAASIYGNPDDGQYLRSANATDAALNNLATFFADLPLFLDDTTSARDPEPIARLVHAVTQAAGRQKANLDGLAANLPVRTILFITGEADHLRNPGAGGTRARQLELTSAPFPQTTNSGVMAKSLQAALVDHHGHVGPVWVQWLIDNSHRHDEFRTRYSQIRQNFVVSAGRDNIAGRRADNLAVIRLAAELAHEALEFEWLASDPTAPLLEELNRATHDADVGQVAIERFISWFGAHQDSFVLRENWNREVNGFVQRFREEPSGQIVAINVHVEQFNRVMGELGYDPALVQRIWRERTFTTCNSNRTTRLMRTTEPSGSFRFISINARGIQAGLNIDTGNSNANRAPREAR
ncbi:MAG: DUF927 domain-containing protein [Gemmataceae bacterium]|nr:DUF927 domain-containing protein [Gemmataceae bacterium]